MEDAKWHHHGQSGCKDRQALERVQRVFHQK
jgi:hypothetical protein